MAYFALPYQVLFHDTMAYGSHHHMTNLKFQNVAREALLFGPQAEGQPPWREQLKDLVLLTREAYSFNLAPVTLGEKVAILLTYEAPTRSTVRLCFRVIREDGQPVSCGYQTLIVVDRQTYHLVPAPPVMTQHLDPAQGYNLLEPLTHPSFTERLRAGNPAVKTFFPDAVCALGEQIAGAPPPEAYPKIVDERFQEYRFWNGVYDETHE